MIHESRTGPYVGPQPFIRDDPRGFYGRDAELESLTDLVVSDRIVLLYAPSGAGKSSLIEARLAPRLEREGLSVMPTARVGVAPQRNGHAGDANRYVQSAVATLGGTATDIGHLELGEFLDSRRTRQNEPQLLILDQFEEIFTSDPTDVSAKQAFFKQLGAALRDRSRWALISMREEYIAGLDTFLRFVPTQFSARFRLDLLNRAAAEDAIKRPAADAGVDFSQVAGRLARELSMVRIQNLDGTDTRVPGPYVEPVQLQVVCVRLWEHLPIGKTRVTDADVDAIGDVDHALADYYGDCVSRIARETHQSEREIREWFDKKLITPQGVRNQVLRGNAQSDGLPTETVDALVGTHLVRAEERHGFTWIELAHDRLVAPVKDNNTRFTAKLSEFQRKAEQWDEQKRSPALLLRNPALNEAQEWARDNPDEVGPREREFLTASDTAARAATRLRWLNRGIGVLAVIAALLALLAAIAYRAQIDATSQVTTLAANTLAANAMVLTPADPGLGALLALEAAHRAPTSRVADALRNAVLNLHELTRLQHSGAVLAATFSPDSDFVATGTVSNGAFLWETPGNLVAALTGHTGRVSALAFSHDGGLLATASDDATVRLWDGHTGTSLGSLQHEHAVVSLAFSPDDVQLATGSEDGSVRMWRLDTRQVVWVAHHETGQPVPTVSFDSTGAALVSGSWDRTARVWDASTGNQLNVLNKHTAAVVSAAFSPDGTRIVTGSWDSTARLWDARTGASVAVLPDNVDPIVATAFSPDGTLVATGSSEPGQFSGGRIRTWDAHAGNLVAELQGFHAGVAGLAFSPDSGRVLAGSDDNSAREWDSRTGTPLATFVGHTDRILGFGLNANGSLAVTASADGSARIWSVATAVQERTWASHAVVLGVAFDRSGTGLLTSTANGETRVWDADTGSRRQMRQAFVHPAAVYAAAISPDARYIATASWDDTARIWDMQGREAFRALIGHTGPVLGLAYSSDGAYLATASADHSARVWDTRTGESLAVLDGHAAPILAVSFNSDGQQLLTAGADGVVRRWSWRGGGDSIVISGIPQSVVSIAFSANAALVAAGDRDGTTRVWDATTGQQRAGLRGQAAPVSALSFSPDANYLVTASGGLDATADGNAAVVWDLSTAHVAAALPANAAPLTSVAISPDGERIATASDDVDGTVRVYYWRLFQPLDGLVSWVTTLTQRLGRELTPAERSQYVSDAT